LGLIGRISAQKQPVGDVNPYVWNISHLRAPTFPPIHLPNSQLRIYPERGDYTGDLLRGLPLVVTSHRGSSEFNNALWSLNYSDDNLNDGYLSTNKRLPVAKYLG
jgi:hypothetical protein